MANEKYTPEGLPIISEGVMATFHRDGMKGIEEKTKDGGITLGTLKREVLEHMRTHNPALYGLYQRHDSSRQNRDDSGNAEEGENIHFYLSGLLDMYKLFLSQAEVNALE